MSNILYIANFKETDKPSSLIYDFIGQENQQTLINIFDNIILKDIYYHHFIKYSSFIKFDTSNSLNNILKLNINKFQWFVFLSNQCLYNSKYTDEIYKLSTQSNNNFWVYPQNCSDQENKSLVVSKNNILKYIQQSLSIQQILNTNISAEVQTSFESVNLATNVTHTIYQDDLCIFAYFINNNDILKDSMVYINKSNNRAYSIKNNIVGYVTQGIGDSISIEWQIDESVSQKTIVGPKIYHYTFSQFYKCYTKS